GARCQSGLRRRRVQSCDASAGARAARGCDLPLAPLSRARSLLALVRQGETVAEILRDAGCPFLLIVVRGRDRGSAREIEAYPGAGRRAQDLCAEARLRPHDRAQARVQAEVEAQA